MPSLRFMPTLLSAISVTLAVPAHAEDGEGGGTLSPGYLHTWVGGSAPTFGNGVEVSWLHYPRHEDTNNPWAFGAFGQLSSYSGTHVRTAIGAEATFHRVVGLELGWAYRGPHDERAATQAIQVAPFVSIGFVAISMQIAVPLAKEQVEASFVLTVKLWPFRIYGEMPWVAPGREPRFYTSGSAGGRPVRTAQGAILPAVVTGRRRVSRARRVHQGLVRETLAALWLADARVEHSSIAAFRRLSRELAAHGASRSLVQRARRAAVQEIDHARRCFGEASRWDDRDLRAGEMLPTPTEPRGLIEIALESWLDGCIGEGVAAATARVAGRLARSSRTRSLLTRVARDESEHATLAWDVVRFALERGGAEVATAIARATPRLPPPTDSPIATELAREGQLVGPRARAIRERVVRRALARRDRLLHPDRAVRDARAAIKGRRPEGMLGPRARDETATQASSSVHTAESNRCAVKLVAFR